MGSLFVCFSVIVLKMMISADDLIAGTEMNPSEAAFVYQRLMLAEMDAPSGVSIGMFSQSLGLKPMLVARTLSDLRPEDQSLRSLISTNEFLIKTFGKGRISRNMVEGGYIKTEKFWRNNDPLGVYQPGDMFYVDDNHPWMSFFPILILAPTAFVMFLISVAYMLHVVIK